MKPAKLISGLVTVAVLSLTGCNKKAPTPPPPSAAGVTIDIPKLRAAFPTPSPDVATSLDQVGFGLRYGDYNKTQAELTKLAANPTLTEPQKKVVNDVLAQVKQAMEKGAGGKPAQ